MDYLATAEHVAAIAGAVVIAASSICAMTATPDPNTWLGKIYRVVEILAGLVGRAKEIGILKPNPQADKIAADAVAIARDVLGKAAVLLVAGLALSACAQIGTGAQKAQPWLTAACNGAEAAMPNRSDITAGCVAAELAVEMAATRQAAKSSGR